MYLPISSQPRSDLNSCLNQTETLFPSCRWILNRQQGNSVGFTVNKPIEVIWIRGRTKMGNCYSSFFLNTSPFNYLQWAFCIAAYITACLPCKRRNKLQGKEVSSTSQRAVICLGASQGTCLREGILAIYPPSCLQDILQTSKETKSKSNL